MHSLSHKNIKSIILYILIGLFAYSSAGALSNIMAERTLGSIFRHFLPTAPYLILMILISLQDIRKFSFSGLIPSIPSSLGFQQILKGFILLLLLGIPAGLFVFQYIGDAGLLVGPLSIFLIISLFISCFYIITEKEIFGLLIFIASVPFLYFIQGQLYMMGLEELKITELNIPLSAIYLIVILICFFMVKKQGWLKKLSREVKKINTLCMLFILIPVFSIIFSKDSFHSFTYYLMDIFLPVTYFFILMSSIKSIDDIKYLILALIISAFLYEFVALYFMYKEGSLQDITTQLYVSKIFTGFSSVLPPLMIPFQILMYSVLKGWKRQLSGVTLLIFLIYLFLANYRTAIGAAIIGFILFYYFYYRTTVAKKVFFSISVLLLVVISKFYLQDLIEQLSYFRIIETIQRISAGESLNLITSGRTEIWRAALCMIYDYPILGIGPDMWSQYIWQYSSPIFRHKAVWGKILWVYAHDPHNLYLLIWINYGIPSFICYLSILFIAVRTGAKNIKESFSRLLRDISVSSLIALVIWIVMSFFTMRFFNHSILLYALIFWSIIAIIFKLSEFNSNHKTLSA